MPKIVKYNNNKEAVIAFITGQMEEKRLSSEQKFYFERIVRADDLYRQHGNIAKCVKMLFSTIAKLIELKNLPFTYSERTAYNDLNDAQAIYGSMFKYDRNYNVGILMDEINQAIAMAKIQKDAKSLVSALKEKSNAIYRFMGDSNTLKMEDLEIGDTIITFDLKQIGINPKAEKDLMAQVETLLAKKPKKVIDIEEVK